MVMKKSVYTSNEIKLDITKLQCNICNLNFDSLDLIVNHLISVHNLEYNLDYHECFIGFRMMEDNFIQCGQCVRKFQHLFVLLKHFRKEHFSGKHLCTECGKAFVFESQLNIHKKKHIVSDIIYKCQYCDKEFSNCFLHRSHERNHQGGFGCHKCGEKFPSAYKKRRHEMNAHNSGFIYECDVCNAKFVYKSTLEKHKQSHDPLSKIACKVCGLFVTPRHVKNHMIMHTGVKDQVCSVCGKEFLRKNTLKVHMKTHK